MQEAYQDDRYRSNKPSTFLGFVDTLRELWKKAGMPGDIIRKDPFDDNAEYPLITYRTIRKQVSKDFGDYKPRHRSTIEHPHMKNEWIELWGQIFDLYVEFSIHSKSQEEADEMVVEFEEFIELYKGYFKLNGVQDIRFYAQLEDKILDHSGTTVAQRTLQYTVRIERVIPKFLNQINDLAINASILHNNQNEMKEEES